MRTEVIVVGAGPTGLMLANELTLAGIPAVVLEKQRMRSAQSRARGLQPRTAEVLDLCGLLEPLLDRAQPRREFGGHFAGLPVELDCRPWQTRHPYPVAIPQARLEDFLELRLVSQGVPVLRGHEVWQSSRTPTASPPVTFAAVTSSRATAGTARSASCCVSLSPAPRARCPPWSRTSPSRPSLPRCPLRPDISANT